MTKARMAVKVAAGCLLVCGSSTSLWAAPPTVAQVLGFKPRQDGIQITTPTAAEEASCKIDPNKAGAKVNGWLLKDAQNTTLRRFLDVDGDGGIDVWSYYKDGVEVYRELDTNANKKADQYRWLNTGGAKWGVDANEDGKIDSWRVISPEEVAQEVLAAITNRDFSRVQTLLLTEAEIKALDVPAGEAARLREGLKNASTKFSTALSKLTALNNTTRWLHLEMNLPQVLPADQIGGRNDLIVYPNGLILSETNGKNEWVQTGQLIQVGAAWRLVDGPSAGLPDTVSVGLAGGGEITDKEMQPLLERLNKLDQSAPTTAGSPTEPNKDFARYNIQRADILEQIVAVAKPDKRDPWIRQIADSLSSAAQSSPDGDATAYDRLVKLVAQTAKDAPGSNLAAYVTFREMTADYSRKLARAEAKNFATVQEGWVERLSKFVAAYPKAEDTPDALLQLGMVSEFIGKEPDAKKWYQQLASNFSDKPQAAKAGGAIKRLELEGQVLALNGPKLDGSGNFDISSLRGKLVVVYYWASWNSQCVGDFAKLKLFLDANAGKVELVAINLDTTAQDAQNFLKRAPAPGTHLFQAGGLESPLATSYGILGLPNTFLVGKDGKVLSRAAQINGLEDEIKKQTK